MTTAATAPNTPTPAPKPAGGLEGVVAAQSEICFIDGNAGRLVYRGYEIQDLVEHASFEETAYLLWHNKLPNKAELATLKKDIGAASVSKFVYDIVAAMPKSSQPMDVLRTAASASAGDDPDLAANTPEANLRKAIRLTAIFPIVVTAFHRSRTGQQPVKPDPSLSIAGNFLYTLTGTRPHDTLVRVMDAALVLHAEHGFNASTFAARVTAATLSDMHASVTSALAALKGPLHGGANQDVMELLLTCNDANDAEAKAKAMLANKQKIPGFGHRVYKTFDPRAHYLRKMSKQLGEAAGNSKWYEMSERLIPLLKNTPKADGQPMNLNPNVDFFSASTYYTMNIPLDLFTPIFAIARVAGWTAHVMEQHRNNRIIRPTDDYVGPFGRVVEPIDKRK